MSCLRSKWPQRQIIVEFCFQKTETEVKNRVGKEQGGRKYTGLLGNRELVIKWDRSKIQVLTWVLCKKELRLVEQSVQ